MPSLRRVMVPLVLAAVGAALVWTGEAAAAASTTRFESTTPFSFAVVNPCNGDTGTLSGAMNAVTQITDSPEHFLAQTTTLTDETFTADDPNAPSASGHGVAHSSFIDNHAGGPPFSGMTLVTDTNVDVFHAPGITVVIHATFHQTINNGTVITTVDKPVLVCHGV